MADPTSDTVFSLTTGTAVLQKLFDSLQFDCLQYLSCSRRNGLFQKLVSMLRTFIPDMSQHNAQGLDRKSWIPISSPSSPMSRAAPPTPTLSSSSRLAPYTPASYLNASPRTARKLRNDISDDEKQEIRMAFELFDSRKVGKLSYREMKVAMRALDFTVKKAEVRKLMQEFSKDGSDEIDHDEFMQIMTKKYKEKDPDEDLAKAFRFFDEDGTGKISMKNLRKIARDLGETITDEELEAMIDEFDKDGDGEISELEFFGLMKRNEPDE